MYALKNKSNWYYKSNTVGQYVTNVLSKAVKFKTKAEAEFVLQDLKSRSVGLQYQVVEVE
jgi:hypothetical protein